MARTSNTPDPISYIRKLFVQEGEEFLKIKASAPNNKSGIQIGSEEGKLIYLLLKLFKAKNVLELGTLVGYSTLWIAKALPKGGQVISIEKSPEHYNIAKSNLSELDEYKKITLINDDALNLDKYISSIPLDAVFIDANKQNYPKYLELVYPYLKKDGLIMADNVFLFGSVYNEEISVSPKLREAIMVFNTLINDKARFESIIIPTQEGLSISLKK